MNQSHRRADYDQIAPTFDRRYQRREYAGVELALREFIGNEVGLHVLEAGCGTGHWLDVLQSSGSRVIGLDFSAGMLSQARNSLPEAALIRGTALHLPLPAASLDRVFCINAMHHFPDKPAFLREVHRVLRPTGKVLSVGLDPHTGMDHWHIYDYFQESLPIDRQRYPSAVMLREWTSEAGFENCTTREVEHWITRLPAREVLEQGRLDKVVTSQLSVLTNEEYDRGIQRIQAAMERAEAQGQTLFLTTDLRMYATTASV